MKTKIIICIYVIFLLLLIGCNNSKDKNRSVQGWLETNIANADSYVLNMQLLSSYAEYDKQRPEGIPETFYAIYKVYIIKDEKKAKIITKGVPEKTHYLSIVNDKTTIYRSTDDGFIKESYNNAQLADALSAILFPDDVSIFEGKVVAVGGTGKNSISLKTFGIQRSVSSKPFYLPYNIISGKNQEKGDISFNFDYDINAKKMHSISMHRTETFYRSMYFIFNGFEYENIYTKHNIKYDQSLTIYYSDCNQVENFELPLH